MNFQKQPRSEHEAALLERCAKSLPVGVRNASYNPDYMMVIKKAQGARITDCSGNEYLDYLLGSGPMFLGHAHPAVVKAVEEQLRNGTSYLMVSEPAIELADEIVAAVPCAEQVSFHNSGSEATFFAMRVARAFRKRDKILKFEGGYHGMGDAALMSTQWTKDELEYPLAHMDSSGIPESVRGETLIAPYNDFETTSAIIEKHADELGCVIVEPLHRTIPPKPGFLQELRKITAHLGIPLIFDEVVTGFRLGLGGAQELYGVTPDLCALGKTISGGHPFGVLCGKSEIMQMASPMRILKGDWARLSGTFSSNPVSCRAALAIIAELKKPGFYEEVERKGKKLRAGLEAAIESNGMSAQVLGESVVFQPWFTKETVTDHRSSLTASPGTNLKFIDKLLDRGIVKGHEKFFVSAAHTDEDIDYTIEAMGSALGEIAAG
ncbi:MAG: glutamate-1-semialdehyde 2,1-aminomutase [Myxococcota bacterium]|jgi:glutamate-1-semialdehyde 2,1-aminomutase